jgi:hypothetical protein
MDIKELEEASAKLKEKQKELQSKTSTSSTSSTTVKSEPKEKCHTCKTKECIGKLEMKGVAEPMALCEEELIGLTKKPYFWQHIENITLIDVPQEIIAKYPDTLGKVKVRYTKTEAKKSEAIKSSPEISKASIPIEVEKTKEKIIAEKSLEEITEQDYEELMTQSKMRFMINSVVKVLIWFRVVNLIAEGLFIKLSSKE